MTVSPLPSVSNINWGDYSDKDAATIEGGFDELTPPGSRVYVDAS